MSMGVRALAAVAVAAGLLAPGAAAAQSAEPAGPDDLARIRRVLDQPTTLRDSMGHPTLPTFRVSVTGEPFDIWGFWGDPEDVWRELRPRNGAWHDEFVSMVTPDDFKGLGPGMGNGERAQLAATGFLFALAMKRLTKHFEGRPARKAKEEVQRELEAFYALHPEARPAPDPTPP